MAMKLSMMGMFIPASLIIATVIIILVILYKRPEGLVDSGMTPCNDQRCYGYNYLA